MGIAGLPAILSRFIFVSANRAVLVPVPSCRHRWWRVGAVPRRPTVVWASRLACRHGEHRRASLRHAEYAVHADACGKRHIPRSAEDGPPEPATPRKGRPPGQRARRRRPGVAQLVVTTLIRSLAGDKLPTRMRKPCASQAARNQPTSTLAVTLYLDPQANPKSTQRNLCTLTDGC